MAEHVFFVLHCKTKDCTGIRAVRYIGEYDGRPNYAVPADLSDWLDYECSHCGKAHRYTLYDLKVHRSEAPPLSESPFDLA
jgi:hypothetical protein